MNLELFFLELIANINALASKDARLKQSFGFKSQGEFGELIRDLRTLIRNYRSPHHLDKKMNLLLWKKIVHRNKELDLGLVEKHKHNVKLKTELRKFMFE